MKKIPTLFFFAPTAPARLAFRLGRLLLLACVAWPAFAASVQGASSSPDGFVRLGSMLYFATNDGQLWQTNGRAQTTTPFLIGANTGPVSLPAALRGELYFFARQGTELWASSGVQSRLVARTYLHARDVLTTDEHIVFTDETAIASSDGTTAGTRVLRDFGGQVSIELLAATKRLAYFTVYDSDVHELALWRTDGTRDGTYAIASDIDGAYDPVAFGDLLLYASYGLWRTDGTASGTFLLHDEASDAVVADGALWFTNGAGLWRSDGTPQGTQLVSASGADARLAANANGRLLLLRYDEKEIRISAWQDGVSTEPVIVPGYNAGGRFAAIDDVVIVAIQNDEHGYELWRTDATQEGTFLLRDIAEGPAHGSPYEATAIAGRVVFVANDLQHGYEPWVTDGTREGTRMLANVVPEAVLRGRVTDAATGAPIAGARVTLYDASWAMGGADTAEDGTYAFEFLEQDSYDIEVTSTTHVAEKRDAVQVYAYKRNTQDFALRAGGTLSGRITDPSGAPVAGIRVIAAATYGAPPIATAVSSVDGTYILGGLPEEQSWLVYTTGENGWSGVIYPNVSCAAGCSAVHSGTRIRVAAGERRDDVHFSIARWGKIRGRVADAVTGLPTGEWVQVTAYPQGKPMETWYPPFRVFVGEDETEFELTLPDGTYHVLASWNTFGGTLPGAYDQTWYPSTTCEPCTTLAGSPVSPVAGQTIAVDFLLPSRFGHVAGRVLTMDGKPAANVALSDGYTYTKADGTYVIRNVQPGPFRVKAATTEEWAGTIEGDAEVSVEVQRNAVVQAPDLRVHRWGTIRGHVIDSVTRFPLSTQVFVIANEWTYGRDYDGYVTAWLHGAFFVGELGRGPFDIRVSQPGYEYTIVTGTTDYDTDTHVRILMKPAYEVTVSPAEVQAAAAGGKFELHVEAPSWVCATTPGDVVAIDGGKRCTEGSGTIPIEVRPNPSPWPRVATIAFPGTVVTITQAGAR